ncbi:ATP-binding protein [Lactococcus nasutitermitis]|uniref:Signal transduction histidine-protein kinase ArlS n=1 Tax=Lactococcus nasutitermitis TaxID=1652957 RepID=A0ABV9JBX0_9LACT|nr:HAMP domain-containing histidine kinase [Lactococcus nasutitermitis]
MKKFQTSHKKKNKKINEKKTKKSILLRWAFANTIFCFITFTIFAALIYQLTVTTYVNEEKANLRQAMNNVSKNLEQSEAPLTLQNLHNYIDYTGVPHIENVEDSHGAAVATQSLSSMIGNRRSFYIFDNEKHLIYSTSQHTIGIQGLPNGKISVYSGSQYGYLVEQRLVSSSGTTIGYLQAFYDMEFYHNASNKLLTYLLVLELVALIIAQAIGYFMARHFIAPLSKLHKAMQNVAQDPTMEFTPIEIKTDDEIEELAEVYNDMMTKTNSYLEQQKRFVSDVSHELRTPLAVLDGHINLLNRWGKDDPEILEESLEASREEIIRMKDMLEEMLALSRLENIDLDFEKMDCDVLKVSNFVLKNFRLVHQDFQVELDNQLTTQKHAKIYENHYEQGLMILLDNAAKYSPDDGRKSIKITLTEDDEFIITSVSDQGLGISEEDLEHVFERFFRADKARSREISGTGLGLSIISRLVENYQGEVEVTSELGKGSTFTLKIPKI